MKTNVIMIRHLANFEIEQRTFDGYFEANSLLNKWNTLHDFNKRRKMSEFLQAESTIQFLEVLENEVSRNSANGIYQKFKGKTAKNGTRELDQVWMHPYLFIDFAMWINPKFKLDVIRFVYDQLIHFRHSAGDNYKGLTSAVSRFEKVDYVMLAKGLNYIVFGHHENNLRQNATEIQLKDLAEIQQKLAFAIDMGYIKSFDELINEIRRLYILRSRQIA